jgi:hypothetical protein
MASLDWIIDAGGTRRYITGANSIGGYSLSGDTDSFNPLDATIYYFGVTLNTIETTANRSYNVIPHAGRIYRIDLVITNQGTLGSNETSSIAFRLNNTTDTVIDPAITTNSLISHAFNNLTVPIVVAEGDTFEIKWTTPTYATNPTNVRFHYNIFIAP